MKLKVKKETIKNLKVATGLRAGSVDGGAGNGSGGGKPSTTTIYRAYDD